MRSRLNKVILSSILLVASFNASAAGLWIEPMFGVSVGGNGNVGGSEVDRSGHRYGGRVGIKHLIPNMVLGLDYRMGKVKHEVDAGSTLKELNAKHMGTFLSYTGVPLLHFWGTWFFDYKDEIADGLLKGSYFKGSGWNLGMGYSLLPFLNLNVEYSKSKHDEWEFANGSVVPLLEEIEATEFIVGISIPISL
ncbi:MAG: hypothetical protein OXB84_06180 [Halobacteriovoraceae bacterium]|nr:hypothetical protein [Halobacteriovoraceae bacterium]